MNKKFWTDVALMAIAFFIANVLYSAFGEKVASAIGMKSADSFEDLESETYY